MDKAMTDERMKRAEEYAQGLFNTLSKDRYLTDYELNIIAGQLLAFAAEEVANERARCEKVVRDKYDELAKRSYPPPKILIELADAIAKLREGK
jgi:hypothetical protein